jgi:hypothetical protein
VFGIGDGGKHVAEQRGMYRTVAKVEVHRVGKVGGVFERERCEAVHSVSALGKRWRTVTQESLTLDSNDGGNLVSAALRQRVVTHYRNGTTNH